MTLCVGALCEFGNPRIVASFDRMETTTEATAETVFKMEKLGRFWWALIAGTISDARELASVYRKHLRPIEATLSSDDIFDELHRPAEKYHTLMRDRLSRKLTSLSYDNFRRQAPVFPDDISQQVFYMPPRVIELLLIGCTEDAEHPGQKKLHLFKYYHGDVWECDNFAAIGSGSSIAEAALYQRQQNELTNLHSTVYAVYEAQRLGQIAPGVGKEMSMNFFYYNRRLDAVVPALPVTSLFAELDRLYGDLGPRKLDPDLQLPPQSFAGFPADE